MTAADKDPQRTTARAFLTALLERRYRGRQVDMAADMGIHQSTLNKALVSGSIGLEPLLRLSLTIGQAPLGLLREAGKDREAELLQRVCGQDPIAPLSEVDRQLLRLSEPSKRSLLAMIANVRQEGESPPLERRAGKRKRTG